MYPLVPPLATTVAVPFVPPKQLTFVCDVVAVNADGCVIVNVFGVVQAFASVIVQVNVPAVNPVAVALVPPVGAHE